MRFGWNKITIKYVIIYISDAVIILQRCVVTDLKRTMRLNFFAADAFASRSAARPPNYLHILEYIA